MNRNNLGVVRWILITLIPVLCTSCIKKLHMTTNTLVDRVALPCGFEKGSTFLLVPAKPENPLFDKEVTHKIAHELQATGYKVTSIQEAADYRLLFDATMSSFTDTVLIPKFALKETHFTKGLITEGCNTIEYQDVSATSGSSTTYVPEEITLYKRELIVHVYDEHVRNKNSKEDLVWQGTVTSNGECDDLRLIVDYHITTLFKYFGCSTGRTIQDTESVGYAWKKKPWSF